MCGRYEFDPKTGRAVPEAWLRDASGLDWERFTTYDARPETKRPVVAGGSDLKLEAMRWGWHPSFMRGPLINARWETVPTKSTFKRAFAKQRCVVPATGYFEWQRDEKDKPLAKFLFRAHDGGWLRIAGLWQKETYTPKSLDQVVGHFGKGELHPVVERRFLVLTRPMQLYGNIHDRTPVILSPAAAEVWLDPNAPERDLFDAAAALADDHLIVRSVTFDKTVGKIDGAHLVEPLDGGWPWQ